MSVVASASGTRIDCDNCDHHVSSPDLTADALRNATGFAHVEGRDLCWKCQPGEDAHDRRRQDD